MKYDKIITAFTAKEVKIELDRPSALQVDGDVISGVTEYSVTAAGAYTAENTVCIRS